MQAAGLAVAFLAVLAHAADAARDAEGPLQNDVFLPSAAEPAAELARGDALLRAGSGAPSEDRWAQVFGAWQHALELGQPGDAVADPDPPLAASVDATRARRTDGLEDAVFARLLALGERERALWRSAVEPEAAALLARALGDRRRLTELERTRPATRAAARAALALADLAVDEGDGLAASTWCARADRHAALLGPAGAEISQAAARRAELARSALGAPAGRAPSSAPAGGGWEGATALVLEAHFPPGRRAGDGGDLPPPDASLALGPGRGVRPGLAFLSDGRVALQTAGDVVLIAAAGDRIASSFDVEQLVARVLEKPDRPHAAEEPPGWPLLPATDGERLFLVVGRARFGAIGSGGRPNALCCVRPPAAGVRGGAILPALAWTVAGESWIDESGAERRPELLAGLDSAEIQPGALVLGDRLLAQARSVDGRSASWLLCMRARTGEPLWRRLVCEGAELAPDPGRIAELLRSRTVAGRASAQPLVAADARVFAGTHLGAGAWLDALDGRIHWTLASRRRDPEANGWSGSAPVVLPPGPRIAWAPADADRAYLLDAADAAAPLFAADPISIGDALALIGADASGLVVAARTGTEHRLAALVPGASGEPGATGGSARVDAGRLPRGERWSGAALLGPTRVAVASDRALYLFDRTRELYLLDRAPLGPAAAGRAAGLWSRGERLYLAGSGGLWIFRTTRR